MKIGRTQWRTTLLARLAVPALVAGVTLPIAACGSDSASSASGSGTQTTEASSPVLDLAKKQLDYVYKGTYELPTAPAPKPVGGKTLWVVTVGMSADSPAKAAGAFKTAAARLGWKVRVFDGKFNPNEWLNGIREAIQAGADGIWTYAIDCPAVKAAVEDAKRAKIPLVIAEGRDCGSGDASPAGYVTRYNTVERDGIVQKGDGDVLDVNRATGSAGAWWLVEQTQAKAKVIVFEESDAAATIAIAQGVKDVISRCDSCEIVETVKFVGTDLGPKLQQKAEQALIQHPEANAVHANYDTAVTSGIGAAVRSSGRKILLAGGEGFAANIALLRQGLQSVGVGADTRWEGWAGVDDFLHIFNKVAPRANSGFGVRVYDKDHNLPPEGQAFTTGMDYPGAFLKSWGLQ